MTAIRIDEERPPKRRRGAVFICLLAVVLLACSKRDRPDVVLITIDTLRADRVGSYGHAAANTPVMDGLAAEGMRFEYCESPIPVTLPSHATIFTGQAPPSHGVRNNLSYRLPASPPSLAEAFAAEGYATAAFVAAFPVDSRFGLDRGFDHYDDALPAEGSDAFHFRERPADAVVSAALEWLGEKERKSPVFVWLHFFEPHAPYEPPAPHDAMANPYDGEIAAADAAVGEFLRGFGSRGDGKLLVAVTSDHGEGAGDHGEQSHAFYLYESTLRVPWILHGPGIVPAGRVVQEAVGLVDVAPTLLSLAGLGPDALDAEGIAIPMEGEPPRRPVYAETLYGLEAYGWSPMFALRDGPHKVIRSAIPRAFDLADDPGELVDLHPEPPEWVQPLLDRLDEMILTQSNSTDAAARNPTAGETEAIRSLGYVSGSERADAAGAALLQATRERPDATARYGEFEQLTEAQKWIVAAEYERALSVLRAVLAGNAENAYAWSFMGDAYRESSQPDSAAAAYERTLALHPQHVAARIQLARLRSLEGRHGLARDHFEQAVALDPENEDSFVELMELLSREGRQDEVRQRVLERLQVLGESAALHGILARLYFVSGELESGSAHLTRARAMQDTPQLAMVQALYWRAEERWRQIIELIEGTPELARDAEALLLLGMSLEYEGDAEGALQAYRDALNLEGSLHLAHARVGWLLATQAGQAGQALVYATRALELDFEQPDYHDVYVEVLERLQMTEDARSHLREARKRFPNHAGLIARAERLGLQ